jgi:hypothetical protein
LASVNALAEVRYQGRLYPRALALRELIDRAVEGVLAEIEGERGLDEVRQFLDLYRMGASVSAAARNLGRSREHCSRSIKRRALTLLADHFAALATERRRSQKVSSKTMVLRAS